MSILRTIESRIAGLVEGTFGKVFRTNVQPVEIARRLVTEMEANRRQTLRQEYAANVFEVYLSRDDHRQLREIESSLCNELSEYLAEHARRHGYALASRPRVTIHLEKDLDVGSFGIAARIEDAPAAPAGEALPPASSTVVFDTPVVAATPAPATAGAGVLVTPDGPFPVAAARISIGRGKSNDVVLHDSSVSREHAEIVQSPLGGFVLRDLGSTNGVLANGTRVREHPLQAGDRLVLGSVELRFEHSDTGALDS